MALGGFFSAFRWGEVYPKAVVRFPRFLSHFLSSCNSKLDILQMRGFFLRCFDACNIRADEPSETYRPKAYIFSYSLIREHDEAMSCILPKERREAEVLQKMV